VGGGGEVIWIAIHAGGVDWGLHEQGYRGNNLGWNNWCELSWNRARRDNWQSGKDRMGAPEKGEVAK